jgi:two-component system, NarL family, sensor histidine kinase DevS
MVTLIAAILAQVVVNRGRPLERAMLGWFGLSVLLGAGSFVLTVILPVLLGNTPQISQGYAFLFFLVIYAGLALGVARFRLFDLAGWSFRVLFYLGGVALLLALDAVLIYVLSLERVAALGVSLAVVGLMYLPLRDQIGLWLRGDKGLDTQSLFERISEVTLATTMPAQMEALRGLVQSLFDPLRIEEEPPVRGGRARLLNTGEGLHLPMPSGLPSLRLYWAGQGRRLFSRQDALLADSVTDMLDKSIARQRGYDLAVEEERRRISRDVHDNIGVQLLGALHSTDGDRKNNLIRQTLSDLRQIISNPVDEAVPLARLLADLRAEVGEHLDAAGIEMSWDAADLPQTTLSPQVVQTLRALLRETSSNVIRHSGATQISFVLTAQTGASGGRAAWLLTVEVADNGQGLASDAAPKGNGLKNITHRIEACGGEMTIASDQSGTRLRATLVLDPSKGTVVVDSLPMVLPVQGARHDATDGASRAAE